MSVATFKRYFCSDGSSVEKHKLLGRSGSRSRNSFANLNNILQSFQNERKCEVDFQGGHSFCLMTYFPELYLMLHVVLAQ